MRSSTLRLLAAGAIVALLYAAPSLAQDVSAGSTGGGEAPRSVGTGVLKGAQANPAPSRSTGAATRALGLDPAAAAKAFTIIGRSSDGKDVTLEPGQNVLDAIKSDGKRTKLEGSGEDTAAEGGSRDVVGQDNRMQVTNSTSYPFVTVGYLQTENKKGEVWGCTAALIGPKVALTAASCLYNHSQPGGWYDKIVFWPAVNGENNVPYGGFDYDTAYVFNAYVTDYDGTYDTIWQYDVGIVTFKDALGDSLGWLGYTANDFGDLQATMVAYQDDKPAFTMWKSTCNVVAENVGAMDFVHDCDATGVSMGAPVYYYDQQSKGRFVVGVNIGPAGDAGNWALRLYGPIVEWINTLNK